MPARQRGTWHDDVGSQPTAKKLWHHQPFGCGRKYRGGAAYLNDMINRLPESIPESQRMWFALASYNIGYAHVEDARQNQLNQWS